MSAQRGREASSLASLIENLTQQSYDLTISETNVASVTAACLISCLKREFVAGCLSGVKSSWKAHIQK